MVILVVTVVIVVVIVVTNVVVVVVTTALIYRRAYLFASTYIYLSSCSFPMANIKFLFHCSINDSFAQIILYFQGNEQENR